MSRPTRSSASSEAVCHAASCAVVRATKRRLTALLLVLRLVTVGCGYHKVDRNLLEDITGPSADVRRSAEVTTTRAGKCRMSLETAPQGRHVFRRDSLAPMARLAVRQVNERAAPDLSRAQPLEQYGAQVRGEPCTNLGRISQLVAVEFPTRSDSKFLLRRAPGADRQDAIPHVGNERRHDEQDERDHR